MTKYMNHEDGTVFLLEISDILDNLGIPFFLIQGTALGAYRDRGFTLTEQDIDIGILIENFHAGEICKAILESNYAVETRDRHSPFSFCHTIVVYKDGIKADLVGWHLWEDKRFATFPDNPDEVLVPLAIVHRRELLENYQTIDLFGREFLLPKPIETYLTEEYGDWKTPREDHVSRRQVERFLDRIPEQFIKSPRPYFSTYYNN